VRMKAGRYAALSTSCRYASRSLICVRSAWKANTYRKRGEADLDALKEPLALEHPVRDARNLQRSLNIPRERVRPHWRGVSATSFKHPARMNVRRIEKSSQASIPPLVATSRRISAAMKSDSACAVGKLSNAGCGPGA
jgi:hypothetical protein